jgi:L-amino acid N-acyltransferase YncA
VSLAIRPARSGDAERIAEIHNEGVEERIATFRAEPRAVEDVSAALAADHTLLVAELDGAVAGWASVGPYEDSNDWYTGIGEATVYVAREARGAGVGKALLGALEQAAEAEGRHKLIAKIFDTNLPSLGLFEAGGYRKVGTHRRHGQLDGDWRDVVILEKLIGPAADDA